MKILSIAIPSFNSEAYMKKCIESLLPGGDFVEILIVDDGSTDGTAAIADDYEARYPGIVRAIHQENGGHGAAVNAGLAHASGEFFKVIDSDDWADADSYQTILDFLKDVIEQKKDLDLLLSNYVYEKVGARHKKVMKPTGLPRDCFFAWDDIGMIRKGHYILMHSIIYRTQLLRDCGLELPRHTFYVDNIYAFQPLPYVKTMYYLDVDFYRYFIGRSDQSVNEKVMIKRVDQQLRVNKLMVDIFPRRETVAPKCYHYMRNYLEIITTVSFTILTLDKSEDAKEKRKDLWTYIHRNNLPLHRFLKRSTMIRTMNLPGRVGHRISIASYHIAQKLFGFN